MLLKGLLLPCLSSFDDLINDVDARQYSYEFEVPAASWMDELGRLRIWAGNVGAHQTGPSSLDFRLRDASHIRDEVTKLLKDLKRLLKEAHGYISREDHEDESLCGSDSLDEDPVTELQALFGELATIIQCLYKLAMLIRNPAQHDFLAKSCRTETAPFEHWDQQHVRNKFPQAEEKLILRLGRALTRRRGYLKYLERHTRKLAKGLEDLQDDTGISDTTASDFQPQPIDYDETPSESGISQTSYAASLLGGGAISVPAQPKDSTLGEPFQHERHVGRHLEELALFVLPRDGDDEEEEEVLEKKEGSGSRSVTISLGPTFRCTECAKDFINQDDLSRHIATHNDSNHPTRKGDDLIATASTDKSNHSRWYCCQCKDGPQSIARVDICVMCRHWKCGSCSSA
ncbi:MAG: hypothetical protein Q9172_007653 [Xanthocarpia lactea]